MAESLQPENAESTCRQFIKVARRIDKKCPHLMWAEGGARDLLVA